MDFLSDTLAHGRKLRVLVILDEYTRECLAVEADTSVPGLRVIRVLEQLARTRVTTRDSRRPRTRIHLPIRSVLV